MNQRAVNNDVFEKLQQDILALQGFRQPTGSQHVDFGLGPIELSFPNQAFPVGAVHEFVSENTFDAASTTGFMAGLLGTLMKNGGMCLWISMRRMVFPPDLKRFGVEPDRIIFIDLNKEKDLLWCIEEALKCQALAAVVGELDKISFTESRRLQLAVEQSRVTGFLHRSNPKNLNTIASVCRWQIPPIPSELEEGMPGVGHPRWKVRLLKVRNGEPGEWSFEWSKGKFQHLTEPEPVETKVHTPGALA